MLPTYLAEILFGLGHVGEAIALWNLAAEQRSGWMAFLRCDPSWDPLRSDPRYAALVRQLELSHEGIASPLRTERALIRWRW